MSIASLNCILITFARTTDIFLDLANITLDIECELSSIVVCLYHVTCRFERNGTYQYHSRRDGFLSTHYIATKYIASQQSSETNNISRMISSTTVICSSYSHSMTSDTIYQRHEVRQQNTATMIQTKRTTCSSIIFEMLLVSLDCCVAMYFVAI